MITRFFFYYLTTFIIGLSIYSFVTPTICDLWKMENKKKLREYKRKYEIYRHHAWAGLGLLTVFLATQYLYPNLPSWFFFTILTGLIVYSLIGLLGTYRYRMGLSTQEDTSQVSQGSSPSSFDEKKEKTRAKIEKKRLKAEVKKIKKEQH